MKTTTEHRTSSWALPTLVHPPLDEISLVKVLHALGHEDRLRIFVTVARSCEGVASAAMQHGKGRTIPGPTMSMHIAALREAGLLFSERRGIQVHNTARLGELDARFPGLIRLLLESHGTRNIWLG